VRKGRVKETDGDANEQRGMYGEFQKGLSGGRWRKGVSCRE
jgi:hypothetical protein